MLRIRIIPLLLLKNHGLVKTVIFKHPRYVGDPINAVKIFNEKEVDELIFLDITATVEGRKPDFTMVSQIAGECFMPFGYGGGVRDIHDMKELFNVGVEKVVINSYAVENPVFIKQASDVYGSQSIVVSIDVKRHLDGLYGVYIHSGRKNTNIDPVAHAVNMQEQGAGELVITSIARDGTMSGYDIELIRKITSAVDIPVIASGGAGRLEDFADAITLGGASAVAAGSMFVFQGKHRAVLIQYPSRDEVESVFRTSVGDRGLG